METTQKMLESISDEVTVFLQRVLDDLAWVRSEMNTLLDQVAAQSKTPTRSDLEGIRDALKQCLSRSQHSADRIGVASAVNYLSDFPYWMEWWGRDDRGQLEPVGHSLNPQRDSFYDYSSRNWFSIPATSGTPAASGPYVDYGGINSYSYTVTVALAINSSQGLAAVAGADVLVDRFEKFLRCSGADSNSIVMVNPHGRVIASNTGTYLPGDLLSEQQLTSWQSVPVGKSLFPVSGDWRLILAPA